MRDYFDEFIKESQAIIAIPSVQGEPKDGKPFGIEVARCLDHVLGIAKDMGFRVHNHDYYYGWAEIGEGELFGILGHLDVVPFGEGWDYPPTSGAIVDGVMYGRGVMDDKVPILSTLYAVKELVDKGLVPNKRIRIIFGCNEESGWQCIRKYVEEDEMPVAAFSPDSDFPVIYAEKGVLNYEITMPLPKEVIAIHGGERPNMVMESVDATLRYDKKLVGYLDTHEIAHIESDNILLHFDGVSAHGSTPDKGENALFPLLDIMSEVYGGVWSDLQKWLEDITGGTLNIGVEDEVSGHLTQNVGMIYSDDMLHFTFDIRYPISYNKTYIYDSLVKTMGDVTIKTIGEHDPLYQDKDSTLVKCLLEAYNEYAHDNAEPIAIGGATYARALKNAVAFGPEFPGHESTIHQKNERAAISDLKNMYEIYKLAIRKLCFE